MNEKSAQEASKLRSLETNPRRPVFGADYGGAYMAHLPKCELARTSYRFAAA
jgi:hypothetical protein